ncbi:MAG: DUF3667 domain-containing protein [Cyclobacteriaceae bacterium]|nr:DUF3667 domain-containing protein [Cyclobacteriaceae bacterium]
MDNLQSASCLNCGATLHGTFCHHCGQKVIEQKERTLKYFTIQFFGAAFFLENSFLKNLWRLVSSPGIMAADYSDGRRKRWMAPFSLFLLINLIYFLVNPLTDFNLPLHDHLRWHDNTYGPLAVKLVDSRVHQRNITFEAYERIFNSKTINLSKSLMVLNVPVMALFLYAMFFKKRKFFADHFVYSLYLFSFLLLIACIWIGFLNVYLWIGLPAYQAFLPIGLFLFLLYYIIRSIRKFYQVKGFIGNTFGALGVLASLLITIYSYRFIMFVITFVAT